MSKATCFDSFIIVEGSSIPTNMKLLVIYVYAPQEIGAKRLLWSQLLSYIPHWNGEVIMMGDFNEVRFEQERHDSIFNN